jgi:hypothetical protein
MLPTNNDLDPGTVILHAEHILICDLFLQLKQRLEQRFDQLDTTVAGIGQKFDQLEEKVRTQLL